ncbi:hypothetical protein NDU88_001240 [Pleurodeles waltl]|uniref:Uncharacterized protein n=1 Tax=Pleurodeles waltl TaxID=8319 RepID=A0AAV7S9W4_PLEWA|nr:hypothetical protein NDU88_001240 [Pleurodeles waltl]
MALPFRGERMRGAALESRLGAHGGEGRTAADPDSAHAAGAGPHRGTMTSFVLRPCYLSSRLVFVRLPSLSGLILPSFPRDAQTLNWIHITQTPNEQA